MNNKDLITQLKAFEDNLPVYFCKKEEMCFSNVVESEEELDMLTVDRIELMEDKIILTNVNGVGELESLGV